MLRYCLGNMAEEITQDYPYSYDRANGEDQVPFLSIGKTLETLRRKVAPFRFQQAAKTVSKELRLRGNESILEIGSGLGLLGKGIIAEADNKNIKNIKYFGVELACNPAKKSKNWIEPVQADAVHLPFTKNSFDYIISTDVLEHIADDTAALKEIYRVLKPGGKAFLVIADPSEARFDKVSGHIRRSQENSDVPYWEKKFLEIGFKVLGKNSKKYRSQDWRKIFNLPFLVKLKDKPGFACAFNPVNRPGVYIVERP